MTIYEIKNVTSNNILLDSIESNILDALKKALDMSKADDDCYEVLKNGLRFATAFKSDLDIVYPRKTFKED